MNRVFIRDIEEIREFVRLHKSDDYFDTILRKMMR
ncbi:Uncharacterised protein [uncultured archaeon]|nr:Uncharacterised protein [uncultured archaeon]